jgi:hypothetical protein
MISDYELGLWRPIGHVPPSEFDQEYYRRIVSGYPQLKEGVTMIANFEPKKIKYWVVTVAVMAVLTSVTQTKASASSPSQGQPLRASGSSGIDVNVGAPTAPPAIKSVVVVGADSAAGIPMNVLIEQVAANIHRGINVDPGAKSNVMLYGQKISEIGYADLLTILKVNGYTAYEMNNYINVVPIREARELPVPIAVEGASYPDDQFVTMTLTLKSACAAQLVPIVRPLLSEYAFVAASVASNTLWLKDTFANLKGVESMVREVDAHSKQNGQCDSSVSTTQGTAGPAQAK